MRGLQEIIARNQKAARRFDLNEHLLNTFDPYRVGYQAGVNHRRTGFRDAQNYELGNFDSPFARGYRHGWAEGD